MFLILGAFNIVLSQNNSSISTNESLPSSDEKEVGREIEQKLSNFNITLQDISFCPTTTEPILNDKLNFIATLKLSISSSSLRFLCKTLYPGDSNAFFFHETFSSPISSINNPYIRCRIPIIEPLTKNLYYLDAPIGELNLIFNDLCREDRNYSSSTKVEIKNIPFPEIFKFPYPGREVEIPPPEEFYKKITQDMSNLKIEGNEGFCYLDFNVNYNNGGKTTSSVFILDRLTSIPSQEYNVVYKKKLNILPNFSLVSGNALKVDWRYFYNYGYLQPEKLKSFNCQVPGQTIPPQQSSNFISFYIYTTTTETISQDKYLRIRGEIIAEYLDKSTLTYSVPDTLSSTIEIPKQNGNSKLQVIRVNILPSQMEYSYDFQGWQGDCHICGGSSSCNNISISYASYKDNYSCGLKFNFIGFQFDLSSNISVGIIKVKKEDDGSEICNITPDSRFCNVILTTKSPVNLIIESSVNLGDRSLYNLGGDCSYSRFSQIKDKYVATITVSKNYSCIIREINQQQIEQPSKQDLFLNNEISLVNKTFILIRKKILYFRVNLVKILNNFLKFFDEIKDVLAQETNIVSFNAVWEQREDTTSHKVKIKLLDAENNDKEIISTEAPINSSSLVLNYEFYKDLITTTNNTIKYLDHFYALEFSINENETFRVEFYLEGDKLLDRVISQLKCGDIIEHHKYDPLNYGDPTNQPYSSFHKICFNNKGDVGSALGVKFESYQNSFYNDYKYFISFQEYIGDEGSVIPISIPVSKWITSITATPSTNLTWGGNGIYKFGAGEDQVSPASSSIVVSFPNLCYFDENGCNGRPVTATATLSFKGYAIKDGAWKEITKGYNKEAVYQTRITYIPPAPLINLGISTTTPTTKTLSKEELRELKSVLGNLDLLNYFIYSSPVKDNLPAAYWSYYNRPDEATTTRNPFFALNDEDLCQIELWTATGTNSLELFDGSLVDEMINTVSSSTISEEIKKKILNELFSSSLIKVIALKYLLTPMNSGWPVITDENQNILVSVEDFQNIFGFSTPVDREKSLTKNFLRDIIKDKVKNMQDLRKIELRFICYQNWDGNNQKINLASNLNAGRVDGVDAVVESVSFELIPLSASIYKQTQEYSVTKQTSDQQKSKTVTLKISVNDEDLRDTPVNLKFISGSQSSINITVKSQTRVLESGKSTLINIGTTTNSGIFIEQIPVTFEYSTTSEITIELSVKDKTRKLKVFLQ